MIAIGGHDQRAAVGELLRLLGAGDRFPTLSALAPESHSYCEKTARPIERAAEDRCAYWLSR